MTSLAAANKDIEGILCIVPKASDPKMCKM